MHEKYSLYLAHGRLHKAHDRLACGAEIERGQYPLLDLRCGIVECDLLPQTEVVDGVRAEVWQADRVAEGVGQGNNHLVAGKY